MLSKFGPFVWHALSRQRTLKLTRFPDQYHYIHSGSRSVSAEKDQDKDSENRKLERAIALEEVLPTEGRGTAEEGVAVQQPSAFRHFSVSNDSFGTLENPRKIPSLGDSRFVGCTGRPAPNDHQIRWLNVTIGATVKCPICGQMFQLQQVKLMDKIYVAPLWSAPQKEATTLEIIKEGCIIQTRNLKGREYVFIGRAGDCDIQLEHPSASRYHAVLQFDGLQPYLFDLGSTHGTFLSKKRLEPRVYYPIAVGESFRCGMSSRVFVVSYEQNEANLVSESYRETEGRFKKETKGTVASRKTETTFVSSAQTIEASDSDNDSDKSLNDDDEERKRLEALGGYEDVLGANFGDDSDDEFYDRTKTSNLQENMSQIAWRNNNAKHLEERKLQYASATDYEQDELDIYMKLNQETLEIDKNKRQRIEEAVNEQYDPPLLDESKVGKTKGNDDLVTKKDENDQNDHVSKNSDENTYESMKRPRVVYGPTRASCYLVMMQN
eukprot:jgi/Galph1/251/GphlegSOOS_G4970.1